MISARFVKAMAAVVLFNSVLFLCTREDVFAGEREDAAKKYTEQLHKAKEPKAKIEALKNLGELGQIKRVLIADALPDIYKAVEDKDPGVRAAAAETLGKSGEPYNKAGEILVKMLKEEKEDSVKIGVLKGLSAMGTDAKGAAPAVRAVVKATAGDKKSKLGAAAKETLKAVGGGKRK